MPLRLEEFATPDATAGDVPLPLGGADAIEPWGAALDQTAGFSGALHSFGPAADPFVDAPPSPTHLPEAADSPPDLATGGGASAPLQKGDYDDGYKAGWEDAERKSLADRDQLSEALLQSVQDLSFTLQEARVHVLKLMRPLLDAIMTSLVPQVSAATLPSIVIDEVEKIAADLADEPLILRVCPADEPALQHAITALGPKVRLQLLAEASLVSGQVLISATNLERRIDLDEMRGRILNALRTLTSDLQTSDEMVA